MMLDERYLTVVLTLLTSFGYFWMCAPIWLLDKIGDFISDPVNLVVVVWANLSVFFKAIAALSNFLAILTPIVSFFIGMLVLIYNGIKVYRMIYKNPEK